MEVILNKCYGGFGVSDAAYRMYAAKSGLDLFAYDVSGNRLPVGSSNFCVTYYTKDFGEHLDRKNEDTRGYFFRLDDSHRTDPLLIEVVKELGDDADSAFSKLKIVDIPDGMDYVIDDYDGIETLHQKVMEW